MTKNEGFSILCSKKSKILYFLIPLVEIWLVLLKLKFLVFCHSQIGLMLTKYGQNRSFWASNGSRIGFLKLFLPSHVLLFPKSVFKIISRYSCTYKLVVVLGN